MSTAKTILIVDDSEINRLILSRILDNTYVILEADNGQTALDILKKHCDIISCIVLDLVMPIMNGFEFLAKITADEKLRTIPVVVSTGDDATSNEINALKAGAWDFVRKPYVADILNFRIKNAIERSQLAAFTQLKYLAEFDTLTGIYNRSKLYSETEKLIKDSPDKSYVVIRFDINRFSLINSFYGTDEGNNLLIYLGHCIKEVVSGFSEYVYGRLEADIFGLCIPFVSVDKTNKIIEDAISLFKNYNNSYDIVPCFGLYIVRDHTLPANIMFDRATLASKKCKGNYIECFAYYNEEMRSRLELEQEIINDMNFALQNNQFDIYIQPKYNIVTNTPAGGEALVRWFHPQKGMISPAEFIPVFEQNGFISKLDYYVWEKTCKQIRSWLDCDRHPHPISVNVSRVNLYDPHFVEKITALVDKYQIPHELFQIELTESAYTDNPEAMKKFIVKLQQNNFTILMDDFGSGYSSLNVLKNIPVDILKIDMKFFSETEVGGRGQNIVASVIRMSKWLGIPVVAEGVENAETVKFLREIGCEYIQGYYYAKPMPVEQYDLYACSNAVFRKDYAKTSLNETPMNNPQIDMVMKTFMQPVAVFEYAGDKIEVLRVNDSYYNLFCYEDSALTRHDMTEVVAEDCRQDVFNAFNEALKTKEVAECDYHRLSISNEKMWINLKIKYISSIENKHIFFGCLTDITAQKEIDFELHKFRNALNSSLIISNKMLIVDDSTVNREYLKLIFEKQFTILEAANGKEALDILAKDGVDTDIILLDLMMPVMDGTQFLQAKKKIKSICEIPVLIISADDTPQQQTKLLALGANDYIIKPFVEEVVVRRVNNVLESDRRFKDIIRKYNAHAVKVQADSLTGIYNKVTAQKLINKLLSSYDRNYAYLVLDIDNFSSINKILGIDGGNKLLVELTQILKSFFRTNDIIARLGGDEICVFMDSVSSVSHVAQKCEILIDKIHDLSLGNGNGLTCSIGFTIAVEGDDFDSINGRANIALNNAKMSGKDTFAAE